MCEKLQKITALKKLVGECCGTCAEKSKMQSLAADLELLIKSEKAYEQSWEMTMMALVGSDGLGSVKRIVSHMLETLESIERMPPQTVASLAPQKAKLALQLIEDEKNLARNIK